MNYIFWIFIAAIILAPLPFGLAYGVFQAFFACIFFVLMATYVVNRVAASRKPAVGLERLWPESVGLGLVLLWGTIQLLAIMPLQWHHPLWVESATVLGRSVSSSMSLARGDGFESLVRFSMYGAVFWLAMQLGRKRNHAVLLLMAIVVAGTVNALYGLLMHLGGINMILWVEKTRYLDDVTGTFINRNTFGTYLGLCLLGAGGLYLAGLTKALESGRTGRDRAMHIIQHAFVRGSLLLACMLIMLTALFLTNSRAGVTSALVALIVLVVFMALLGRMYSRVYQWITISLLIVMIGVFFVSGGNWYERLTATDVEREHRMVVYEQTWQAIGLSPITGYGIGSFEQTYPMFADEKTANYRKAHNDWLEMMFELGVPVALVWFAVLGGLAVRCLAGFFRRKRDHVYPVVGFCACILVGLHSLVDFSLQIPAVAITFGVLLGVGVAQGWRSEG